MLKRIRKHLNTNGLTFRELIFKTIDHVLTQHEILTRASAIAFSAMMAFVPFIMLVMTVSVKLLPSISGGEGGIGLITTDQVQASLNSIFPADIANIILDQIARLQAMPSLPVLSLSIGLSLWTASSLFLEIMNALNRIYGVPERRAWWRLRLTAIGMTMFQCLILFSSLVTIVAWPQIMTWFGLDEAGVTYVTIAKWLAMFVLMVLSFGLTFHVGPAGMQKRKWVTPGAIFGTVVFLAATYGFRLYVQNLANYTTAYGPLGGVMMLLLWFYISSLVLLMAAEMNRLAELASTVGHPDEQPTK